MTYLRYHGAPAELVRFDPRRPLTVEIIDLCKHHRGCRVRAPRAEVMVCAGDFPQAEVDAIMVAAVGDGVESYAIRFKHLSATDAAAFADFYLSIDLLLDDAFVQWLTVAP